MAKPICIVYINPEHISPPNGNVPNFWAFSREMSDLYNETKPDYHWFVLPDNDAERMEFQVLYEKDFTEIQYAELKQLIQDSLSKQINNA